MLVNLLIAVLSDIVAIVLLAGFIYYRRHRRSDLLLAYIALNLGVLAVTIALSTVMSSASTGIGLGLGLFGVLSIIRLRSDQITQGEIAYYFVSLVLGLVAGLNPGAAWITPVVAATLLLVMYVVDHPLLSGATRRQIITLDAAYLDEGELANALSTRLGLPVQRLVVHEIDLVRDITIVDVRYRVRRPALHFGPFRRSRHGGFQPAQSTQPVRIQLERIP